MLADDDKSGGSLAEYSEWPGMPEEDGYALIRHLRARKAAGGDILAIALTGYVRPEGSSRLRAAGFEMHLRKPVDPDEIVAAVASLACLGSR